MYLKGVKLFNFRQFYGEQEVEFSRDPHRNVTLIHAENGVGKTTLLNAILWCFFEKLSSDFERPDELLSHEAKAEGKTHCRVEVSFEYDDYHHVAQRSLYAGNRESSFKVFRVEGYNYKEIPNPKNFINNILPKNMAAYFFFHGEGISSISERAAGDKFRRAIRDILGFTFAEAAVEDLKELKVQYGKRAKQLSTRNAELSRAVEKKSDAEEKLYQIEQQIKENDAHLQDRRAEVDELEAKLARSGNADAARLKREFDETNRRITSAQRELQRAHAERQGLIGKYGWAVFGSELAGQGLDFIDQSTLKGRIPSPYQESFVHDLIEQRQCICGRELIEGTEEYQQVLGLLETANTALISQRVMKARSSASNMAGMAQEFLEEIQKVEAQRKEADATVAREEQNRQTLERELSEIDEAEIQRLAQARKVAQSQRDELIRLEARLRDERNRLKEELSSAERELASRGSGDEQLQRLAAIQDLIEQMTQRCHERLQSYEESARRMIADKVDRTLRTFSRKAYSIRVNQDFEFYLVREDGGIVAKSKGENLLLNLAFVSALINMARERENARGDFLVQGTVAPFVIDAPFGELDETYKAATAQFLPETSKQLVLLLSSSHWRGTVDDAIEDRVGAEYVLISHKRAEQGNKPEDLLEIRGKQLAQSIYGAERDITAIERVL